MFNILYITDDESQWVFRGPHYFQQELSRVASVTFWQRDGNIAEILSQLSTQPDFIVLHKPTSRRAPQIDGLELVPIPKSIYVEDVHHKSSTLVEFVLQNEIAVVFCPYRAHFHTRLGVLVDRFRWLPHCINPDIFRDYGLSKSIDMLMMGMISHYYPFRRAVVKRLSKRPEFVRHGHPGYGRFTYEQNQRLYVGVRYAQELNRAKIFLTCGSRYEIPVAKYFEAPACGAVVFGPGGPDFEALGFINEQTFVECSVDDFEDKVDFYLHHPAKLNRVRKAGYELVMQRHTTGKRVEELLAAISKYIKT